MCSFTVHKEKKEKSKENYYATRKNKIKIVMVQASYDIKLLPSQTFEVVLSILFHFMDQSNILPQIQKISKILWTSWWSIFLINRLTAARLMNSMTLMAWVMPFRISSHQSTRLSRTFLSLTINLLLLEQKFLPSSLQELCLTWTIITRKLPN